MSGYDPTTKQHVSPVPRDKAGVPTDPHIGSLDKVPASLEGARHFIRAALREVYKLNGVDGDARASALAKGEADAMKALADVIAKAGAPAKAGSK